MAYGDFKDLAKRTASDKILSDKTLILLKILNMMDIKEVLLLCFLLLYKFFDSEGSGIVNNKENIKLADEFHKPIIKKLKKKSLFFI